MTRRRLLPASLALLLFALPASANPRFLTDFQVSDCRGDTSYRINAVQTDTGSPHVAIGVISVTPGLNTGNTYPSMSGTWPRTHSTSAPGVIALWRGGSGDGVANRTVTGPNTGTTYSTSYNSGGSATGLVMRYYSAGKTSGLTYPENLPYTSERMGLSAGFNGQKMTMYGTCSYSSTNYGPTNDTPAGAFNSNRGDAKMHINSFQMPVCSGFFGECGVAMASNGAQAYYGTPVGYCSSTSCVAWYDNDTNGLNVTNYNYLGCASLYDNGTTGTNSYNHSYSCDENYYEFYSCNQPYYTSGILGGDSNGAWGFDATYSEYISGDGSSLNVNDISLEAWLYAGSAALSGRHAAMGQGGGGTSDVYIGANNGYWTFWMGNGSTVDYMYSESPASANTWTHVMGVYERATSGHPTTGRMTFYVNGLIQQQSGGKYQKDWTWSKNTGYPFRLGASNSGDYWTGKVDEAAAWSRSLSTEEVSALYDPTVFKVTTAGLSGLELPASYRFGPSATVFYTDTNPLNVISGQGATGVTYVRTNNLPLNPGSNNYVQFVSQDNYQDASVTQAYQIDVVTAAPDAPSLVVGGGISNSAVRWTWTQDYVCNPHSFDVTRTVNPGSANVFPGSDIAASLQPYDTGYIQSGLGVNVPAGLTVRANTIYGSSPLTTTVTAYTLANAPFGAAPFKVNLTSMVVTWDANSNPSYTTYEVSYALNDPSYPDTIASTPVVFGIPYTLAVTTLTGLSPASTYYFRVRAQNGNGGYPGGGQATGFSSLIDGYQAYPTLPTPPSPIAATAVSTYSVVWNWGAVPTAQSYDILDADGNLQCDHYSGRTFDYGNDADGCVGSFSSNALGANTRGGVRLRTVNNSGNSLVSPSVYAFTLARQPLTLQITGQTSNSVNLSWDSNANPVVTAYQLSASLDAAFSQSNTSTITVTGTSASFPGLFPGTSYWFHVRALNGDGVPTVSTPLAGTGLTPVPSSQGQGVLLPGVASSVTGPDNRTKVEVPAGALAVSATVFVSLDPVTQPVLNDPARLTRTLSLQPQTGVIYATGTAREFVALINNVVSSAPFTSAVTLFLPYSDQIRPGVVDDSDPPIQTGSLKAYTLNPYLDLWEAVPSVNVPAEKGVRASTTHFSVYALFGTPQATVTDLSQFKVYPQPWRPGSATAYDDATNYTIGSGLYFDNLPSGAVVTLYTLAGELVVTLKAQANGSAGFTAVWDGKNASGKKVASAVYLARIEGGGKTKIKKVALER